MSNLTITLPKGLTIDKVNSIATYTATLAEKTYAVKGISVAKINQLLNMSDFSVEQICTPPLISFKGFGINKWAAFKPNALNNGHGFAVDINDDLVFNDANNVSGYWTMQFAGYNHSAPKPGSVYWGLNTFTARDTGILYLPTVNISLPEWDVTALPFVPNSISHVGVKVEVYNGVSWDFQEQFFYPIENNHLEGRIIGFSPYESDDVRNLHVNIPVGTSADIDVRFTIDLGYTYTEGTETYEKLCNFPRTGTGPYVIEKTIIWDPPSTLLFQDLDENDITNDITVDPWNVWQYRLVTKNESLIVDVGEDEVEYQFAFGIEAYRHSGGGEETLWLGGTCNIEATMKSSSPWSWRVIKTNFSFEATENNTVSGILNSTDFPAASVDDTDIIIKFTNVTLTGGMVE